MEQANVNTTSYKRKAMIADIEIIKQSETEALLKTTTVMGNSDDEPDGSKDYWYPINKMGKCGAYQGQYAGKRDATDYIESVANSTNSQRLRTLIPQGYDYYYFTGVTISWWHLGVYYDENEYPQIPNPYGSYLLWVGTNYQTCIPPIENEWYGKYSIPFIVDLRKPAGRECSFIDVDWAASPNYNSTYTHALHLYYGNINFGQGVIPW